MPLAPHGNHNRNALLYVAAVVNGNHCLYTDMYHWLLMSTNCFCLLGISEMNAYTIIVPGYIPNECMSIHIRIAVYMQYKVYFINKEFNKEQVQNLCI